MTTPGTTTTSSRTILAVLLGTTLLAAGAVAGFSVAKATATPPPLSLPSISKQAGFADLVATVKPAVVNISTMQMVKKQPLMQSDQDGPLGDILKQFMGPDARQLLQQSARPVHALGSGFLVDPNGYIVTNNHVIDDASDIEVTLADGSSYPARVVGRDTKTDLALLKVSAVKPLPYVAFGDSNKEQIGDWVVAVGNPYGLGGSVTAGIVSARNRDINEGPYDDFLQIDAPINPGNSGGPLFDQSGHVIGIDTAIYSPSGGSVGIGFAIPSDVASNVVVQLREHGHVTRGWLGVQMQQMTAALAKAVGLHSAEGVLVDLVTNGSPAAKSSIQQGDVITSFDGKSITNPRDLAFAVARAPVGHSVPLTIWRDRQEHTVDITIGTQQEQTLASAGEETPKAHLGMELAPLGTEQREQLGIQGGAVVADVAPGSRAERSGVQPGDVILRIGDRRVTSPADAAAQFQVAEKEGKPALALLVVRNGTTEYLPLALGAG